MEICPHEKCTGCYACINACTHGSISMKEDELGAVHPVIDENRCINCNLCIKSCPNNIDVSFNYPIKCYASWITDKVKRKICASGGIGTTISEYVIKHGGVVFGSMYDETLTPIMTYTENIEDLDKFKGSRYVQSLIGNTTFREVRSFLLKDRLVVFIGTPCQIAGLKAYLRKNYENLITVDLICHGVCPTKYLKEEVSFLINKYKLKDVADIRFRGNDGNNFRLSLWNKNRRKLFPRDNYREKFFHQDEAQQYYITGFLQGITLRENCYLCSYARPERVSDITIGDFIGLGKETTFSYSEKNVSSVIINTKKGDDFYLLVSSESDILINVERGYKERLQYKPSLIMPFARSPLNSKFVDYYAKGGYIAAIRKVLKSYMQKRRLRYLLRFFKHILLFQYRSL